MKRLLTFLVTLTAGCTLGQERIGFIDPIEISPTVYLDYFRVIDGGDPWCDCPGLVDSTTNSYFPLGDYTFVKLVFFFKDSSTAELISQQDSSWIYIQKKEADFLFYGQATVQKSRVETDFLPDRFGDDSLVYLDMFIKTGKWNYFYPFGSLSGHYETGNRTGKWEEYRDFKLENTYRIHSADQFYTHNILDSTTRFSPENTKFSAEKIQSHSWSMAHIEKDAYLVFLDAYSAETDFYLLENACVGSRGAYGIGLVPGNESWYFEPSKNVLVIEEQEYPLIFVNEAYLILQQPRIPVTSGLSPGK